MNNGLTQASFARLYNEAHREEFNPIFFQRSNEKIMECIKKVILSCERDTYFTLKVMNMQEIYDYEQIYNLLKEHESKKRRSKDKHADNPYDFINIKSSNIMMLRVEYYIRHNGTEISQDDPTNVIIDPWDIMTVLIVLPRYSKRYYFKLNGNYYSDIFQVVDGSTYNNITGGKSKKVQCNTFKTMFTPIRIYRAYKDMVDINSQIIVRNTVYTSTIFGNHINTMFYIFANYGIYGAMEFLDIHCVLVLNRPFENPDYYCFEKNGIYIAYPKLCTQDFMVQAFAVTIYEAIEKSSKKDKIPQYDEIFDVRFWIENLGRAFANDSIDKGIFILNSLDGTYDIITREELHLPEECKSDIFAILRWLMREFAYLRKKNNIDITIKRLRMEDPIAAVYAAKLSSALYSLSDSGKKVTLQSVKRRIYTDPFFVINKIINMSNLISYRDLPNDGDAILALKYTHKGISGLGEGGGSIQQSYRYVDASHAGILDLDSSTTSDPGMSGMINPMTKIYNGNSFSEYEEPNFWPEKYKVFQDEFKQIDNPNLKKLISFDAPPIPSYDGLRKKIIEENLEIDRPICPVVCSDGSNVDFSGAGTKMAEIKQMGENVQSLFTIKDDDEELDILENDDGGDLE